VAATLALVAAFFFALAATLQQKGALNLPTLSLADPMSFVRLAGQTVWLLGTRRPRARARRAVAISLTHEAAKEESPALQTAVASA
jgi:hypothetical protein